MELVFGAGAVVSATAQLRRTPPAATLGIWRVATASDSAVLKVVGVRAEGHPRWPAAQQPEHPYYWKREVLAYTSGLLGRLRGGLRAPVCRAVFERPDGSAALWLEDVAEPSSWTPELLGEVARRIGVAQAAFAADLPDEPWLSRDWLRAYLDLHEVADDEGVLDRLDALPHTVCHHDLHPGNVLGADATVLVDWAYCGLAPLGLDAGVLVADGIADSVLVPELADEAAAAVWAAYAAGLGDAGWGGDLDGVRWAYLRGTALRLSWLPPTDPPSQATRALLDRWRAEARELASVL